MYLDAHSVEIETVSLCSRFGFTVVYEKENKPRTDGRNIYVQRPNATWSEDNWLMWRATVYHEIGHNVPEMRDCFDLIKRLDLNMASFIGAILNVVDDYRQEHFKHDEYLGRAQVMSRARKLFIKTLPIFEKMGENPHPKVQSIEALIVAECIARSRWQTDLIGEGEVLKNKLAPEGQDLVDKIVEGGYFHRVENATAETEWQVVLELIELMGFDPEKEAESGTKGSGKGKDSGDSGKADGGEGDSEGGSESSGGSDDGEPGAEAGASGAETSEGGSDSEDTGEGVGTIKYTDYLMHKHDEVTKGGKASRIDYTGADPKSSITGAVSSDFMMIDYVRGINVQPPMSVGRTRATETRVKELVRNTTLAGKLRSLLQVISKAHTQHGQVHGKVCGKSLYRAGMRGAGQSYQRRVFKRKIENRILDAAVTVLVDYSGSMAYKKIDHAIACGYMLNEALTALGVPLELIGYSDYINGENAHYRRKLLQGVFKSFDDVTTSETIIKHMAHLTNFLHENADGDHILWAYNRLKNRKEKRKILIVLSDGSPATPRGSYYGYTKEVVETIEKRNIVEIYGLGIMDRNVERLYTHHSKIESSDQLEDAVLNVIKNKILNRK